jgi:malate dehydrogenase (decarboxylating)
MTAADLKRLEVQARDGPSDPYALAKWRILNRLHDRNETMYYQVIYSFFSPSNFTFELF